ncbi:MAG: DNA polymerase III subunit alpha, partial [Planctomycetota bacterium]
MGGFVHLHGHSTYSLLDGACRIPQLVQRAADQGCPALAVTDHGNLFGAIEFYKAARKRGVKPILGFEAYVAPLSRFDRERNPVAAWHLTLLARNNAGWHNLIKLSSAGYLEGFYYVPRIDRELLTRHSEGLVVLSGCLSSETSYWLRRGETVKAREAAAFYHDLFGEHYYLEIQRHGIEDEEKCLEGCIDLARHFGRPLVATNDYHYEEKADADAQELLVCINTGKTLTDKNRMRMSSQELYFKTPEEMGALFRELPESLHSTLEIAEKCNVEFTFGKTHLPAFEVPAGRSTEAYFREVCEQGLRKRYGAEPAPEVWERFEYEFDVIQRMGFTSYFLIVWDFIRYARENGIPVGPGRGSAAGSVLAYALEIVDVDPLRYDLLFERFLNEERISLPDIDIDFCRDGREKVIEYVQKKYGGKERVAQIITFGRMAAKAVIRDVGRVLGVPLPEVDRIAKRIPAGPGVTLRSALEQDAELREIAADPESEGGRLFDFALRLEGCHRNASTHAAGVVIADAPLTEYLPLYKSGEDVSTQFTMDTVEELGLLKMDFLGLKTLTLIDYARKLVEERGGTLPDFRSKEFTRFEDPKTYELLSRGESFGVFQLESAGMRDLLRRLKPRSFEESLVLIALFRPGPLDSGMTDVYCNRKNGIEPVDYDHPTLESTLKETYGVIVYQEQVMLIAHEVAGLTLNQADNLRKAMGKKKPELMEPYKQPFLVGCGKSGVPRETALRIWDKMATFARYGFNKSHATAYAAITYQTAWLKANHPREFMAALLTVDSGNMDKVSEALEECRRLEIPVLPPDVSRSGPDFRVEQDAIRFGLTSVKGVGGQAAEKIVEAAREGAFRALYDLTARVDTRVVNKSTVEALVKAGACDSLGGHRAQLHAAVDGALRSAAVEQADRRAGQMNLLSGAAVDAEPVAPLPDVPSWTDDEILRWERETTGRYWSSHPLAEHEDLLRTFASRTTRTVQECREGAPVVLGGLLVGLQERTI